MSENGQSPKKEAIILKYPILAKNFDQDYEILEVIRETPSITHLVVEEIEYGDIFYAKRLIMKKGDSLEKTKAYYRALEEFTESRVAPQDMIRVWRINVFENAIDNTEEVLVLFEWGEPDCIDLSRLTAIQTLKFLKNIFEMLDVTYNIRKLTHNNICLENIVLVGSQLKLSGWKPLLPPADVSEGSPLFSTDQLNWRDYICLKFGRKRLDSCLVGVLWIQLHEISLDCVSEESKVKFPEFVEKIQECLLNSGKFPPDHVLITKM
jgi:hypothetical protein